MFVGKKSPWAHFEKKNPDVRILLFKNHQAAAPQAGRILIDEIAKPISSMMCAQGLFFTHKCDVHQLAICDFNVKMRGRSALPIGLLSA
jgi:hypothetical protein